LNFLNKPFIDGKHIDKDTIPGIFFRNFVEKPAELKVAIDESLEENIFLRMCLPEHISNPDDKIKWNNSTCKMLAVLSTVFHHNGLGMDMDSSVMFAGVIEEPTMSILSYNTNLRILPGIGAQA
jgi:hypothetical protein